MDITNMILRLKREDNAGLGRIFRVLRKTARLETVGDIILYKMIINTLSLNGYQMTDRSITRHFSNINPGDYNQVDKREIIQDLKNGASLCREEFYKSKERS
jgi:hypothetical protein